MPEFVIVNTLGVFVSNISGGSRVRQAGPKPVCLLNECRTRLRCSLLHTTRYTSILSKTDYKRAVLWRVRRAGHRRSIRRHDSAKQPPMLHHWLHWVEHDQWCLHEAFNLFSSSSNPELIVCSRVVEKALFNWYRTDFVEANMTNQIVTQFHLVFDLFVVWRLLQKLH